MKLHVVSVTSNNTSMSEIRDDFIKKFKEDFELVYENGEDVILFMNLLLPHYQNAVNNKYKYKILAHHVDGNSFSDEFIDIAHKFDLIIVCTNVAKEILINNGVKTKIVVIPLYIKDEYLQGKKEESNKIIFYTESFGSSFRKGVKQLCLYFSRAFKEIDDVQLIVKVGNNQDVFKSSEKIKVIMEYIPRKELIQLMHNCDAYVTLAQIEGFGLPLFRANLLNKRTIVIKNEFSGYNEYLCQENTYYINSESSNSKNLTSYFTKNDTSMKKAIQEDAIKVFKQVYQDIKEKKELKTINKKLIDSFSLENIYQEIKNTIKENIV